MTSTPAARDAIASKNLKWKCQIVRKCFWCLMQDSLDWCDDALPQEWHQQQIFFMTYDDTWGNDINDDITWHVTLTHCYSLITLNIPNLWSTVWQNIFWMDGHKIFSYYICRKNFSRWHLDRFSLKEANEHIERNIVDVTYDSQKNWNLIMYV